MSASDEDITVELVDINDVSILVGVEFIGILVHLLGEVVSIL